ncbi:MAG: efflux RND transporter periplasmic adaptor subunit [Thermoflavifilum sp.]|nr:efflux RND transporter periplasmic adaptor subunit [Thermoflavifilum sp.]
MKHPIMQRILWLHIWIIAFTTAFWAYGCNEFTGKKNAAAVQHQNGYYTCSMHPQIHRDQPGKCPICGMTLEFHSLSSEPETADTTTEQPDSLLNLLEEPVTETVIGDFATTVPSRAVIPDTIQAVGYLTYDQRYTQLITPRVSGWIDSLYVPSLFSHVRKGQPLMRIYSPDLLTVQQYWIQAVRQHDTALVLSLEESLRLQGMLPREIAQVRRSLQPIVTFVLASPASGILSLPEIPASGFMSTEDGHSSPTMQPMTLPYVKGAYVEAGVPVLAILNEQRAWAIVQVSNAQLAQIQVGDPVDLWLEGNLQGRVKGRVDFIPPIRDPDAQNFASIRVYLNNIPDQWKYNSLIRAEIFPRIHTPQGLFIPRSAVDFLGRHEVVWVQDKQFPHVFHVREVQLGMISNDWVQVLSGLSPGERVARHAAYMVDPDSPVSLESAISWYSSAQKSAHILGHP